MASAIVVGTVIGSGVFKKARNVAENVPEFGLAMAVWVLGGVLALLGALALAEVAVLLPRAGGNYVFLREGFGRLMGFLWGWVEFWIIRTGSICALASMFTESFHDLLKQALGSEFDVLSFWGQRLVTIGIIAFLALLNARGTRIGGGVQLVITSVKVGSLVGLALLPLIILAVVNAPEYRPTLAHVGPIWPEDWSTVDWGQFGAALVGVLWAYHGWMNIAPVAEEVKNPGRNIPLALLGGILVLILLYVGVNLAYYTVIPRQEMAEIADTTVARVFCSRLLGPVGAIVASAAVMTSVFGSLNGNLLVGPRLLYAMGQDGLAPRLLSTVHRVYQTPALATMVLAGWACLMVLILGTLLRFMESLFYTGKLLSSGKPEIKSPFDVVTDFAMFGAVALETLAVATLFRLRARFPKNTHAIPYRCIGYPVVPVLYVCIMSMVFVNMFATPNQRKEAIVGMVFIALGIAVYFCFLRKTNETIDESP